MDTDSFTRFVIVLHKVKDASKETIQRHIEHLAKLDQSGALILCGPFTDHPSGMVIVKAKSKDKATEIAQSDPFVREGVRTFEMRTWLIACRENGYLGQSPG
ncbi:MAG: YciI family protein [Bdellovibrionota bacterium]